MSSFVPCVPKYPQSSAAKIFTPEEEMSEDNLRASLGAEPPKGYDAPQSGGYGADNMQPVEKQCTCGIFEPMCDVCMERFEALKLPMQQYPAPQPAPAPREISDIESIAKDLANACGKARRLIGGNASSEGHETLAALDAAIARYAIRLLESRAPQTAPREPYKRGQLLP